MNEAAAADTTSAAAASKRFAEGIREGSGGLVNAREQLARKRAAALDHLARDGELLDALLRGHRVHGVEQKLLHDHHQTARADLALDRLVRDGLQGVFGEAELDVVVLELLLVLLDERVLRLGQNPHERAFVQLVQHARHGEATDKLRDEAVLHEVFRLHGGQSLRVAAARSFDLRVEAERLVAHASLDDLLQADESAAADEENVGGVYGEELLVRVFPAPLRRDVRHGAFQNLQKRLLHALARNVARDRGVLVLAANLIDFAEVDDALLRALHVAVGGLEQFQDDVLHVLADVAGLGQGRRVDDGEGD